MKTPKSFENFDTERFKAVAGDRCFPVTVLVQGPPLLWLTLEKIVGPCFAEYVQSYRGRKV